MRTSERHHLKHNELADAVAQLTGWASRHSRALTLGVVAVLLAGGATGGFIWWQRRIEDQARALLAAAMVVQQARVVPPAPAVDGVPPTPQPPGTYPTQKARLEAALPKFLGAADAYPATEAGRMARYQAAAALVGLARFDEAIAQYDRLIADDADLIAEMAQLGRAEAELRAAKYDAAIASFKTLSERADLEVPKEAMLLELARAYRLAGQPDAARRTLTEIVEQHADSPFAVEARQELEKFPG
jgi:tetratricopeptide (TPR) repeat protein